MVVDEHVRSRRKGVQVRLHTLTNGAPFATVAASTDIGPTHLARAMLSGVASSAFRCAHQVLSLVRTRRVVRVFGDVGLDHGSAERAVGPVRVDVVVVGDRSRAW